jgi:uncharacterized protein
VRVGLAGASTVSASGPVPEPLARVASTLGAPGLSLRDHGPFHWKCVALTGLDIARDDPEIDLPTIYVFAQLHDSQRLNEYSDPEHGPRAADVAQAVISGVGIPDFEPGSERAKKLVYAIREHTTAHSSDDPTIGACWDADRFNLWRVGIEPDIHYISTPPSRERFDALSAAARLRVRGAEPTWAAVTSAVSASLKG